jgi:hypothetical protein
MDMESEMRKTVSRGQPYLKAKEDNGTFNNNIGARTL